MKTNLPRKEKTNYIWFGCNINNFNKKLQKMPLNLGVEKIPFTKKKITFVLDVCNFFGRIKNYMIEITHRNDGPLIPHPDFCMLIAKKLKHIACEFMRRIKCRFVFVTQNIIPVINAFLETFGSEPEKYELFSTETSQCSDDDKLLWHIAYLNWSSNPGKTAVISGDTFRTEFVEQNHNVPLSFYDHARDTWKEMVSNCIKYKGMQGFLPHIKFITNTKGLFFNYAAKEIWPSNYSATKEKFEPNYVSNKGYELTYHLITPGYVEHQKRLILSAKNKNCTYTPSYMR